ncbi:MAG TPA: Hsp20/alpha crystallin family protein [Solirubrobacterales bacterium]|nr:Hsp20/alpha crystallin family protein [Solirubrobacterales bacterium]
MATQMTVWRPLAEFGELRQRVEEMFHEAGIGGDGAWTPSVDVLRKNGNVILRADLPGIKPEEVKITIEDDVLTLSGEHTEVSEEEGDDYMRRERRCGSFSRSMTLPAGVKAEDIQSTTADGVLEVTIPLPKAEENKPVEISTTAKES